MVILVANDYLLEKVAALWIEFWTSANPDIDTDLSPERVALDDLVGWLKVMADNGLAWCEHSDGSVVAPSLSDNERCSSDRRDGPGSDQ